MRRVVPVTIVLSLALLSHVRSGSVGQSGFSQRLAAEPADVIRIPQGEFTMGTSLADVAHAIDLCEHEPLATSPDAAARCADTRVQPGAPLCTEALFATERTVHRVWLPAFAIDRTEVTQRQYDACVRARVCVPARFPLGVPVYGDAEQPVVGVSWFDARRYCAFRQGRLPSEAEWERAARGRDARPFPWGQAHDPRRYNHGGITIDCLDRSDGSAGPARVGSYPDGASPDGLLDMAGNVLEWTNDLWDEQESAYPTNPDALRVDPRGATHGAGAIVRGGSFESPAFRARASARFEAATGVRATSLGFRCAYDAP